MSSERWYKFSDGKPNHEDRIRFKMEGKIFYGYYLVYSGEEFLEFFLPDQLDPDGKEVVVSGLLQTLSVVEWTKGWD